MHKLIAGALAAFAIAPSPAQMSAPSEGSATAHVPAVPDPLDPRAPVLPPDYRSPFSGYVPARAAPPTSWQESNETVRRLQGHGGHLRGSPETGSPATGSGGHGSNAATLAPHAGHGEAAPTKDESPQHMHDHGGHGR
jgi:hypothetical protein